MAIKIQGTTVITDESEILVNEVSVGGSTVIFNNRIVKLGQGTIEQRPAEPEIGMIWFNTELETFEGYNGVEWESIVGGSDQLARTLAVLALD